MNLRVGLARLPMVRDVERAPAQRERGEHGVARGSNAKGDVTVVFDVARGTLTRNDDAPITLAGAQDPSAPGLVAVDDEGKRALVLCARAEHGDPALVLVDLDARATETVRSFEGPGWLCGGFAGKHVVACEQRLGERAKFSVIVANRTVWSVDGMQPPCVPVRVRDDVVALLACTTPDAVTGTGPTSLVALDLASGAIAVLATPAQGKRVRVDASAIVVEGGAENVRVTFA
jgi:hypothetical protein